jgi:DNA-binding GntR family transcriptional regulator
MIVNLPSEEDSTPATSLRIVAHKPLHEIAYANVKSALKTGQIGPGDRLTVRGLSEQLGVSSTPAREALQRLTAEGVLEQGPARTMRVPALSLERFRELTSIRLALEPLATSYAATEMAAEELAELDTRIHQLGTYVATNDWVSYRRANHDLHAKIYLLSRKPTLERIIDMLWTQLGPWMVFLKDHETFPDVSNAFHEQMLAAFQRRDPTAAAAAMHADISESAWRIEEMLVLRADAVPARKT